MALRSGDWWFAWEMRSRNRSVMKFAIVLTILIMLMSPFISVVADIHILAVLIISLALYSLIAIQSEQIVSAIIASIGVLGTMNASVPIIRGPNRTVDLDIVLGDVAIICALIVLIASISLLRFDSRFSEKIIQIGVIVQIPGLLLAAFATWSLIIAPFAIHDVQTAAVFGISQFRYVIYFIVAAGLVTTQLATIRELAGSFTVAMIGHSLFAIAQFVNGEPFGLSYLGETNHSYGPSTELFGQEMMMGQYLGGFVGNNAAYASLAVLAVPVLLYWVVETKGIRRLCSVMGFLLIGILCVPLSQHDTGTIAIFTTSGATITLLALWSGPKFFREFVRSYREILLAGGLAICGTSVIINLIIGPERMLDFLPVVSSQNLAERITNYRVAFEIATQHPITGYGGGNIESVASEVGMVQDVAIHSIFFSFLAETGFVGAIFWVLAFASVAAYAVQVAWSPHHDAAIVSLLSIGACGLLIIAMLGQIWDNHTTLGIFWLFAGMVVAARSQRMYHQLYH